MGTTPLYHAPAGGGGGGYARFTRLSLASAARIHSLACKEIQRIARWESRKVKTTAVATGPPTNTLARWAMILSLSHEIAHR